MKTQVNKWFYNHSFQNRVATGVVKRRKVEDTGESAVTPDDEAAMQRHLKEIETECKKKKKDLFKCFKLSILTADSRRQWLITMKAPTRVSCNLTRFRVLKQPEMVSQLECMRERNNCSSC